MSFASGLIEQVKAFTAKKQAAAIAGYDEVVRAAADGRKADPAQIADALERAGRSADQFAADVNRLVQHSAWAAEAAALPNLERQHETAGAKLSAFDAETERLSEERARQREPLAVECFDLWAKVEAANNAKHRLLDEDRLPKDDSRRVRLAELRLELDSADQKVHHVEDLTLRAEYWEHENPELVQDQRSAGDIELAKKLAPSQRKRLAEAMAERGRIKERIADAERELLKP